MGSFLDKILNQLKGKDKEEISETPAAQCSPLEKSVQIKPRTTKKGIRVIDKHQDLRSLFGVEPDDDVESPVIENPPEPEAPHIAHRKPVSKKTKSYRTNKKGIRILDGDESFSPWLMEPESLQGIPPHETIDSSQSDSTAQKPLKDKHGIPILAPGEDLPFHQPDDSGDERFSDLLSKSLGEMDRDSMLREKGTGPGKRRKLTLKEKLKRYPAPQGQLDLHGYTAIKADLRTETYLRAAWKNMTHTVSIIVGKGLHSEGGAVIPDVVEDRLNKLKKESVVLDFEWEHKKKSSSGCVIVYLDNMGFE